MSEKTCFVIAPIGEAESDIRKRSDQVLKHIIKPAAKECGYDAIRADDISEPGMITSQVIQHIVDDPLVIADLTDRNPNVFYELAVRHAIRKPLVQLIKKGEQIPFDVAGTRTIHVDHTDLDSVEEARCEIVSQIQTTEEDASTIETPISVSLDLQMLRQSDNPEQRSLADVISAISDLQKSVRFVEQRLSEPDAMLPPNLLKRLMRDSRASFKPHHPALRRLLPMVHELRMAVSEDRMGDGDSRKQMARLAEEVEHTAMIVIEEINE